MSDIDLEGGASGSLHLSRGQRRLVLARDRGYAPRQRDYSTGRKAGTTVSGATWQVIEESFISFLDHSNLFAFARTSVSAPQPAVVAEWIEQANLLPQHKWAVLPLIDENRFRLVRDHRRASWVFVKGYPAPSIEVPESAPLLRQFMHMDATPGIEMEFKIKAQERRLASSAPNSVALEALGLLSVLGQTGPDEDTGSPAVAPDANGRGTLGRAVTAAKVKLEGDPTPVDLLEHHLTLKAQAAISLKPRNRSLSEAAVFEVIDAQVRAHTRAIREAAGC